MTLEIPLEILKQISAHGEAAYPEEGAGLLLGSIDREEKKVTTILPLDNTREDSARHNRYLLAPQDYLKGELEADRLGLEVIGVFHSHPDHPNRPSEFDREWAMPWFSYVITSIEAGKASGSRSWQLLEDRTSFVEELLAIRD
jgi:proteasome lid subunit RPN8/RPN11